MLFTDVVPPDMSRRKLAEEALKLRPDLKVAYAAEFSCNAAIHQGVLDRDVNFLSEPFTLQQLAGKVPSVSRGRDNAF